MVGLKSKTCDVLLKKLPVDHYLVLPQKSQGPFSVLRSECYYNPQYVGAKSCQGISYTALSRLDRWSRSPKIPGRALPAVWCNYRPARMALQYGFTKMKQPQIISLIHPENAASIRVAQRLGERLIGPVEVMGKSALMYRITVEEWRSTRLEGT